jgi:hypothetical protein
MTIMIKAGPLDHYSIVSFVPYKQYFISSIFEKHVKTTLGLVDFFFLKSLATGPRVKKGAESNPALGAPFF